MHAVLSYNIFSFLIIFDFLIYSWFSTHYQFKQSANLEATLFCRFKAWPLVTELEEIFILCYSVVYIWISFPRHYNVR